MPEYLSPGVYMEEVNSGPRPIEGVGTAMAAFVGFAPAGPVNKPEIITNWSQYVEMFGVANNGGRKDPHMTHAYHVPCCLWLFPERRRPLLRDARRAQTNGCKPSRSRADSPAHSKRLPSLNVPEGQADRATSRSRSRHPPARHRRKGRSRSRFGMGDRPRVVRERHPGQAAAAERRRGRQRSQQAGPVLEAQATGPLAERVPDGHLHAGRRRSSALPTGAARRRS